MRKRKVLNNKYTLISTAHFPYNTRRKGAKQALLGIGGNMGDVVRRFENLFWYLKRSKYIHIYRTAAILKNPAFGYTEQEDFYNSLIQIETSLTPRALLSYVLRIEKVFGRKRSFKDAPRTLDIDIIFYENIQMETKDLRLPHPQWMKRPSVLIPLRYMQDKRRRRQ
ncbi:MAG: 2-amino-4-hydroxy-6-hydroxymethyldihydropteridine diphosphokinase [Epsilonproteobacteria bacterium]|nr:MAG: 2-amino-4-hydroxy-6-hydroxymethyldihydropteridine diphosphokinase [Campylobacterota bacterium]